ncbi:MAG: Tad domain-containing protein, partial [Acidimicrobiales bacterium]|nr:Tad domain-containing protein [Acidimicrobiales bacterium]
MAILMAILVGMVGFAVDLGLAFNERRQDQASVDSAVLSGAYEWLALGGSEQAIFDEVVRLSYEDIDTSGMSATEWEAMWAGCTDPDAAGRGFTNPISASINGGAPQDIACITIKGGSSEQLRVRLPNQPVPTLFAGLLGFDTFQISAFAEAGGDVGDSSAVIPFMI